MEDDARDRQREDQRPELAARSHRVGTRDVNARDAGQAAILGLT